MSTVRVKICGITDAASAQVAANAGADYLGFIFFEKSPRHLTLQAARALKDQLPKGPKRVGVFVNADLATIKAACAALDLDIIQFHGSERVETIRAITQATGLPAIKAFGVSTLDDIAQAKVYSGVVDAYLFDAKPPKGAVLPGGNAVSFPWHIMKNQPLDKPWFLAGGLDAENLPNALAESGAIRVDISSGVEKSPGVKDHKKMQLFLDSARNF